jgi:hypothetical protein
MGVTRRIFRELLTTRAALMGALPQHILRLW